MGRLPRPKGDDLIYHAINGSLGGARGRGASGSDRLSGSLGVRGASGSDRFRISWGSLGVRPIWEPRGQTDLGEPRGRGASGSDRFRISCGENSKSVWPQCPEIFEASERLSAHKATVATHVSLEPESAWPFRAQPVEPVVRFFRKSHCPGQKSVAKALRDIVVNYVCWDRAERLWQFGVRSKPACRPGRAAVRGCMLIDTRKPGRPTCGLRKTCRSVG